MRAICFEEKLDCENSCICAFLRDIQFYSGRSNKYLFFWEYIPFFANALDPFEKTFSIFQSIFALSLNYNFPLSLPFSKSTSPHLQIIAVSWLHHLNDYKALRKYDSDYGFHVTSRIFMYLYLPNLQFLLSFLNYIDFNDVLP